MPSAQIAESSVFEQSRDVSNPYNLTNREREVMELLMEGLTSGEVGEQLSISPRTVDTHRATLMRKFKARNGMHLAHLFAKSRGQSENLVYLDDVAASFRHFSS